MSDNPTSRGVDCVTSTKFPPCPLIPKNTTFDGYICTRATAGEDIPKGATLRSSTTTDRLIEQTTAADDIAVLGVAADAALSGRQVCVVVGGEFQILVTGAVTRGDFLSSSATAGVATSTGTGGQPGDFAIAMVTDAGVGTRLIWARFKKAEVF